MYRRLGIRTGLALIGAFFLSLLWVGQVMGNECTEQSVTAGQATYLGCLESENIGGAEVQYAVFKGIQYATAERWKAPVRTQPQGRVAAKHFGKMCAQDSLLRPFNEQQMSEECLYLNIWAPDQAKDLPVMVFIHGGAFYIGSGSNPLYTGTQLAANPKHPKMVVVTLNYRLGIFGFLYNDATTGNYGIQDQMAAIEWVHDNIQAFGGDPAKVTLVGESAGAMSIGIHLAIPKSQSWFRSVIMESPYYGIPSGVGTHFLGRGEWLRG
ncbi:carboxylesterase family protein [Candidatus Entotheonella palauensis]|uniref:carboxylesterase family protein n=1 Tax=Candidatus Entotheonella palauensis TaxID=93172 RepID=UPI00277B4B50|nr:carboxylesterase family protein [Candidatus Entotheonella palauensis]